MTTLNDRMQFGHVIRVHDDGSITDPANVYAPETVVALDDDGQMIGSDDLDGVDVLISGTDGWRFMHGYTGQYGSSGRSFIMHPSEFIGGRMERDILSTPGYYAAVVV